MQNELRSKKMITDTLGFKMLLVFILALLLLIPMSLVRGVLRDRQNYQAEATRSIIQPIGGEFSLYGLMIAIPYQYYEVVGQSDRLTDTEQYMLDMKATIESPASESTSQYKKVKDYIIIMPENYSVDGKIESSTLSRGIFKTPVFSSDMNIVSDFEKYLPDELSDTDTLFWDEAVLILATENRQNFTKLPEITVNNTKLEHLETAVFSRVRLFDNSFVYKLDKDLLNAGFSANVDMSIQGGSEVHILPMSGNNEISLHSNWGDVGFTGNWLPSKRDVSDDGFSAMWEIAGFNTPFYGVNYLHEIETKSFNTITTSFLLLNDNYTRISRSIKYAMLFIFIPFFALFLCELLTKSKIHIVQYALIGLANVVFYLLLLSFSEHISFNTSYCISAVVVSATSAVYVWAITKALKLGGILIAVELIIYSFLFGILQLTDFALLFGTIGLFLAIVVAMYFTRNIDKNLE